jgi:hypothetical protein
VRSPAGYGGAPTPLGRSLTDAIVPLCTWGTENMAEMTSIFAKRDTLPWQDAEKPLRRSICQICLWLCARGEYLYLIHHIAGAGNVVDGAERFSTGRTVTMQQQYRGVVRLDYP